jgi:hypothetical protein
MFGYWSNGSGIKTIPLLNTSKGTNFNMMFGYCSSLITIPRLDMSSGTDFGYLFYVSSLLKRFEATGVKVSISFASCNLSRSALVEIFNNLATVTGQTITITGNPGASLLTADDRSIATNKGWTISG